MKIKNWLGEYTVKVNRTQYVDGHFAIQLMSYDDEYGFWEPYGNLTVNLNNRKLPDNFAYVDVNNMSNAEEFIRKYKLGKPTGEYGFSGFCCYPLYEFYTTEINTYVNKENRNKFIEVKRTPDFHYMWRQYMKFDNGVIRVINYMGVGLHGKYSHGGFRRCHKAIIDEVLKDYEVVK